MYSVITDPKSNIPYPVTSRVGLQILRKFMTQLGGEYVGKGTYKCVFSPPIKCLGESKRFGDKRSSEYISAITTYGETKQAKHNESLRAMFDPKHKFTLKLLKSCKVGALDAKTESVTAFNKCSDPENGNFMKNYKYPFSRYDGDSVQDLRLLITRHGGIDLSHFSQELAQKTPKELKGIIGALYFNFKSILWGLTQFQKYKYIHCDLKPANLLYNPTTQTYYIIDFGLMVSFKEAFKREYFISHTINVTDTSYYYRYWPIDAGVAAMYLNRGDSSWKLKRVPLISEGPSPYDDYRNPENIKKLYYDNMAGREKFIMNAKNKFDTYSMGMTMKEYFFSTDFTEALEKLSRYCKKRSSIVKAVERLQAPLLELIHDMLELDPIKRLSCKTASKRYNALVSALNPKNARDALDSVKRPKKACKQFRKSKSPMCENQAGCLWKKNIGCIDLP